MGMKIWVDADACPGAVREILFKAAKRTGVALTLVANQTIRTPPAANIRSIRVAPGFDAADHEIVRQAGANDLVITADIPLAAEVIENGAFALSPRGECHDAGTIRDRLQMRDFMDELRASGVQTGGPPPLSAKDRQQFANQLDRLLTRYGPQGDAPGRQAPE